MNTTIATRTLVASAIAFSWMLATPLMPSSLSADAPTLGAAFAKHGADDPKNHDVNDDHGGKKVKHGHRKDDPKTHDVGDDHGGLAKSHK